MWWTGYLPTATMLPQANQAHGEHLAAVLRDRALQMEDERTRTYMLHDGMALGFSLRIDLLCAFSAAKLPVPGAHAVVCTGQLGEHLGRLAQPALIRKRVRRKLERVRNRQGRVVG